MTYPYKVVTPVAWNDDSVPKRAVRIGDYEVTFDEETGNAIGDHYYGLMRLASDLQNKVDNLEYDVQSAQRQVKNFKDESEYYKYLYNEKCEAFNILNKELAATKNKLSQALSDLEITEKLASNWKESYHKLDIKLDHAKNDYYKLWGQIMPDKYPPKPKW